MAAAHRPRAKSSIPLIRTSIFLPVSALIQTPWSRLDFSSGGKRSHFVKTGQISLPCTPGGTGTVASESHKMRSAALAFSRARRTPICSTASEFPASPPCRSKSPGSRQDQYVVQLYHESCPRRAKQSHIAAREGVDQRRFPALGGPAITMVTPSRSRSPMRAAASSFQPGKYRGENFTRAAAGGARHVFFLGKIDLRFEERRRLDEGVPPNRGLTPEHAFRLARAARRCHSVSASMRSARPSTSARSILPFVSARQVNSPGSAGRVPAIRQWP